MTSPIDCDVCVVGAGSAGLVVAAGAAQMGARTVLIERGRMGGDCLNYGCVPSKALIAAAERAQTMRDSTDFGIRGIEPEVDFAAVMAHVHGVIRAIEPNDSVERFEGLGVTVLRAEAHFTSPRDMVAGDHPIRAKLYVLATGSRPAAPPIPGLSDIAYLTNESVFELRERPRHLIVLGGGPIGLELAQAFRRLGSAVTVLEAAQILGRDDPELVAVVRRNLAAEGVALREWAKVARFEHTPDGVVAVLAGATGEERIAGSHLLVAAGRTPGMAGLGLDVAGIRAGKRGIEVDDSLRTSNRRVWAIGDCNGLYPFTHMAAYQASLFIRGGLLRLPARMDRSIVPWTIYTEPELAQVGLTEAQAREHHGDVVRVLHWKLSENDRAQTERRTDGLVKVVIGGRGRILGAGIVAPHAGELIQPWCLALSRRLGISAMASFVPPYPTLGEISKRAAGSHFTPLLFSERTKRIVRLLLRLR
jgi:pyruvate/2-oxoglutarate dehydrogenase complex dihydrolipoamide dehydrogenase (E3) component